MWKSNENEKTMRNVWTFIAVDIPLPHNIGSDTLWNRTVLCCDTTASEQMLVNGERSVNFVDFLIKTENYMLLLLLFRRDSRHTERPLDFFHIATLSLTSLPPRKKKQNKHKAYEPIPKKRTIEQSNNNKKNIVASYCQRNGRINLTGRYKVTEIFYCCFSFDVINGYFSSTEKKIATEGEQKKKWYLFAALLH